MRRVIRQLKRMTRKNFTLRDQLEELWWAIQDDFYYSWKTPIDIFIESCKTIIKWFPILWKDRDWDHYYILNILKYKIKFVRENTEKYSQHTTADRDIKNMKIAEFLIERLQADNYDKIPMERHEEKWGELVWGSKSDNIIFDNKFSNKGLINSKVKSQEDWEQEKKEAQRIYEHAQYMKKQDLKYLFKHLNKHILRWWN